MFGFPDTHHKQFKNNFIKTVVFQLGYNEISSFIEKNTEIINLFNSKLPRVNANIAKNVHITIKQNGETPILQSQSSDKAIELKSNDGQKILLISSTSLSLTVTGRVYENYNDFKLELSELGNFFNLCNVTSVNRIAIRKLNVIEFSFEEEDNPSDALAQVISPDLVGYIGYLPNSQLINQNFQTIRYSKDDNNLILKYGLNIPSNVKDLAQIIIDIDLFNSSKTNCDDILSHSDKMNLEIFNIFNWSVSDYTKKLLNDEA